jgi:hypothetical protein
MCLFLRTFIQSKPLLFLPLTRQYADHVRPTPFTFTPASMLSCSSLNLNSFQRSLHQARVPALVAEPIISFLPNPHQARYRRMAICLTLWNRGAGTKLINHLKTSRKRSQWTDEHRGNLLMPDATPYSTFEFIGKVFFF